MAFHFDVAISGLCTFMGNKYSGTVIAIDPCETPDVLEAKHGEIPPHVLRLVIPRRALAKKIPDSFGPKRGHGQNGEPIRIVTLPRHAMIRVARPDSSMPARKWLRWRPLADAASLRDLGLGPLKGGVGHGRWHKAEWARVQLPRQGNKSRVGCTELLDFYTFPATGAKREVADRFNWRGQFSSSVRVTAEFPNPKKVTSTRTLELDLAPREGSTLGIAVVYHADPASEPRVREAFWGGKQPEPFNYSHAFAAVSRTYRNYAPPAATTDSGMRIRHVSSGGCPPPWAV